MKFDWDQESFVTMRWQSVIIIVYSLHLGRVCSTKVPGTCASIGYADRCCPPGGICTATDGTCKCDTLCHQRSDCCADIYCSPSTFNLCYHVFQHSNNHTHGCPGLKSVCYFKFFTVPTTCQQMGITQCCNNADLRNCRVLNPQNVINLGGITHYSDYTSICSCDPDCHGRVSPYNCCADAVQIGCTRELFS